MLNQVVPAVETVHPLMTITVIAGILGDVIGFAPDVPSESVQSAESTATDTFVGRVKTICRSDQN